MIKLDAHAAPNAKYQCLEAFLDYFREKAGLRPIFTLSDKDWSEINALAAKFPEAKHQLCFWHALKAIKRRLAVLRCMPGPYNMPEAIKEYSFIDPKFVPVAQMSETVC